MKYNACPLLLCVSFGKGLPDSAAQCVDVGTFPSASSYGTDIDDVIGAQSFLPRAKLPNLTLYPPKYRGFSNITIMGSPTTVPRPVNLSALLYPNMGVVHWNACLEIDPTAHLNTIFQATSYSLEPFDTDF